MNHEDVQPVTSFPLLVVVIDVVRRTFIPASKFKGKVILGAQLGTTLRRCMVACGNISAYSMSGQFYAPADLPAAFIYRGLGGPQSRSGRWRRNSHSLVRAGNQTPVVQHVIICNCFDLIDVSLTYFPYCGIVCLCISRD